MQTKPRASTGLGAEETWPFVVDVSLVTVHLDRIQQIGCRRWPLLLFISVIYDSMLAFNCEGLMMNHEADMLSHLKECAEAWHQKTL